MSVGYRLRKIAFGDRSRGLSELVLVISPQDTRPLLHNCILISWCYHIGNVRVGFSME